MFRFAATTIVVLIHWTYFYGIWQVGMKDRSLIDKINLTFIALTATAIDHCLSAWKTCNFRGPPAFGRGGGAGHKWHTWYINHSVNNACPDVFRWLDADFLSSSPEVQAKKIDDIHTIIRWMIHPTGTDPVMAHPENDQDSIDEDFLDYVLEELIEQPDKSSNRLSSFVAATEASMRSSADLVMGGSATARSSQPVSCSDSNYNGNDIRSIPNMTSIENTRLVKGSMIV